LLLEDVSALQEELTRVKLHVRFVGRSGLFGDNSLLENEPQPKHFSGICSISRGEFCKRL
jgi:hypothetical protein